MRWGEQALWFSSMRRSGGAAVLTRRHAHQLLEHRGEMGLMREACLKCNLHDRHIAIAQPVSCKLHARLPNKLSDRQSVIFTKLSRDVYFVHSCFDRELRKSRWIHEVILQQV